MRDNREGCVFASLSLNHGDVLMYFMQNIFSEYLNMVVAHTCNPNIWEVESERLGVILLGYLRPYLKNKIKPNHQEADL